MTLQEWTMIISAELRAEGFEVIEVYGFPVVKRPESLEESVRLLKFHTKQFPADREIFAEGMLFAPAGSRRAAEEIEKAKG